MKLKNFFLCTLSALALVGASVAVTSCTNDDMDDDYGFTPITPTAMVMDNGDIFGLGERQESASADGLGTLVYYEFTFTPSGVTEESSSSGLYTYADSTSDSRTKTITFYYNASIDNAGAADDGGYTTRVIMVKFTSAKEGVVVSDQGLTVNGETYKYTTGDTITFY